MKAFALAAALLVGLISVSCRKADDVTPPPTQAQLLVGSWVLVQQASTDGQTTHVNKLGDRDNVRKFTTGGDWLNYSGVRLNYTYPYRLTNGVITITGSSVVVYTVQSVTSTGLVLVYSGAPSYPTLTFTDTYARASQ